MRCSSIIRDGPMTLSCFIAARLSSPSSDAVGATVSSSRNDRNCGDKNTGVIFNRALCLGPLFGRLAFRSSFPITTECSWNRRTVALLSCKNEGRTAPIFGSSAIVHVNPPGREDLGVSRISVRKSAMRYASAVIIQLLDILHDASYTAIIGMSMILLVFFLICVGYTFRIFCPSIGMVLLKPY